MTEREKLVEIMAAAVYGLEAWSRVSDIVRQMQRGDTQRSLAAAEAAGWVFVPPDDGR